jgi:hypothetical protein
MHAKRICESYNAQKYKSSLMNKKQVDLGLDHENHKNFQEILASSNNLQRG